MKLHATCMLKGNVSLHTNTFGIIQETPGFNAILYSTSLSPRHVSMFYVSDSIVIDLECL